MPGSLAKPRVLVRRRAATDRQREYLAALAELERALIRGPMTSEVAGWFRISRHGARAQLLALEAKGLVRMDQPRGEHQHWSLTDSGRAALPSA